jgi:membrane-associated phospholipid phosphatase
MNFLTNFGDLTVLLPLSAVMLIWLLSLQLRSSAIWWVVALALCVCLTVLLKIYLYVCQPSTELHSPSGHTSLSTLVYGAIAFVVAAECGHWRRYFAIVIGLGLIASIGLSRVALGSHTPVEIALGFFIGAASLAVFVWGYVRIGVVDVSLRPRLLVSTVLPILLNGTALNAEEMLHSIARYVNAKVPICIASDGVLAR